MSIFQKCSIAKQLYFSKIFTSLAIYKFDMNLEKYILINKYKYIYIPDSLVIILLYLSGYEKVHFVLNNLFILFSFLQQKLNENCVL